MILRKKQLWERFKNKNFRSSFADSHIGTNIASQIVAMREAKPWTQVELAKQTGMAQARISVLENPNYEKFSISTLRRIARAFDVALIVRFVPFSELLHWVVTLSPDKLAAPGYKDDSYHQSILIEQNTTVGRSQAYIDDKAKHSLGLGAQPNVGAKIDGRSYSTYVFDQNRQERGELVATLKSSMGPAHSMGSRP